jgi:hypothetical protein
VLLPEESADDDDDDAEAEEEEEEAVDRGMRGGARNGGTYADRFGGSAFSIVRMCFL